MEDFVTYELAVKLEEKGFDYETRDVYKKNIFACRYKDIPKPTISQVLKWLRKEKATHIEVELWEKGWFFNVFVYEYHEEENEYSVKIIFESDEFNNYEQTALAGIEYCLDNLI